jgi:hypothetical protein
MHEMGNLALLNTNHATETHLHQSLTPGLVCITFTCVRLSGVQEKERLGAELAIALKDNDRRQATVQQLMQTIGTLQLEIATLKADPSHAHRQVRRGRQPRARGRLLIATCYCHPVLSIMFSNHAMFAGLFTCTMTATDAAGRRERFGRHPPAAHPGFDGECAGTATPPGRLAGIICSRSILAQLGSKA